MSSQIAVGILYTSLALLLVIFCIYYPQKRLYNTTTIIFGCLLHSVSCTVLFDLLTYMGDFSNRIPKNLYLQDTIFGLYAFFLLCTFYFMADYCYLVTYAKSKPISKLFLLLNTIPAVFCIVLITLLKTLPSLISSIPLFNNSFDEASFRILGSCYVAYAIICSIMVLFFRTSKKTIKTYVTLFIGITECILIWELGEKTNQIIASAFMTLDVLILFITIQFPKSCVDNMLHCFDSRALALMFEDYTSKNKNFYMLTIQFVGFKYLQVKHGLFMSDKILKKLYSTMPKDTDTTSTYRYNEDIFVTLTTSFEEFQKMLSYANEHLYEKWTIDGVDVDVSFHITHFYKDFSVDKENMNLFLDKVINFLRRDISPKVICVNNIQSLMNRETLVLEAVRKAINNNSFSIYAQPIWNLKLDKFEKAEILIRLKDDNLGLIPPDEFILLAEEWHLVKEISRQVIYKTLQAISEYNFSILGIKSFNINLSALDLTNGDLYDYLIQTMKRFKLPHSIITLEVTETAETDQNNQVIKSLNLLHEEGFSLALDDYGTGYSNMERILSMPFDFIKIDKNMLNLSKDSKINKVLLHKNIEMLKECGYTIVVEGVETQEQVDSLKKLDVDFIQGYLYARPIPIESMTEFIIDYNNNKQ